ncbi:nadp-dependent malic enzyme [hydrocarbon metagenome]|uniref:Nadp-dependent malic enzyme n=1 Tax=hydrocarbon metagenome TaxID=938273 RepID=A0A0W8EZT4_9ZZZZ
MLPHCPERTETPLTSCSDALPYHEEIPVTGMAGDEDTNRLYQESLDLHEKYKGKIEISPKVPLETSRDLARAYTPGVAAVCRAIARDHELAYRYTLKANTVAIVTDGSAVLGLGNIGGYAAIPVMEGKALLFKMFAGIDAFPLCFESYQTDFVDQVRNIAPVFGGINLEDIAAPKCFEVEEALQDIGIPVMHDDQHGTAITVLAALLNACTVTGKDFSDLRIVVSGAGAAGYAIVRLLKCIGYSPDVCQHVREILVCDRQGIIHRNRKGLYANKYKFILADETNQERRMGGLAEALEGADVFIGVSAPDLVTGAMIRAMNDDPIVFAMANPVPEVMPDVALAAGAAVVGTGRSDYPNQINNALAFPGVFRGALDAHARVINDEMKVAAAHALARYVESPVKDRIMPLVLDRGVVQAVATAVSEAARYSGAARDIG